MSLIRKVHAREILDSRGNPTVEVDLYTDDGMFRSMVPSGASTGIYEALELRDGDKTRYLGKGVLKAVSNVNEKIAPALIGKDVREQFEIDNIMLKLDGSKNKSVLGANAILAVSMAVCKAGAKANNIPVYAHVAKLAGMNEFVLPVPSLNVINGGSHAGNKLDIQEFMILPSGAPNFREAMRYGAEVYHNLKKIIESKHGKDSINVGDEGGFAPPLDTIDDPICLINEAIEKAGYAGKIHIGLDAAGSEYFKEGKYHLEGKILSGDETIARYLEVVNKYDLVSFEDPFDQDDWESYTKFTAQTGSKLQIVGDDLLVTNPERISEAIEKKACNALLLKVNQIGSVSESIQARLDSNKAGWGVMVSHRSGETEDSFIADLVVGLRTGQIKTGAPCRSERNAKYNQLMRIEEELGEKCRFAGEGFTKL